MCSATSNSYSYWSKSSKKLMHVLFTFNSITTVCVSKEILALYRAHVPIMAETDCEERDVAPW